MAAYENPNHVSRLVIIPRLRNAFADLYISAQTHGAVPTLLESSDPPVVMFQVNEHGAKGREGDVYNFPIIMHADGLPWIEANSFLLNLVANKHSKSRPTDEARRKASKLLHYLMFCENNKIDWKDFSGKRPSLRPTYRYYRHLLDEGNKSAAVINQYTGTIYDFYKFVAQYWLDIDMERVDTVKKLKLMLQSTTGHRAIDIEKRSQTRPTAGVSPVPIGFVRDDGEDLRPLTNSQLSTLLDVMYGKEWSALERLIVLTALMTGARKQTVLTLRVRHLEGFTSDKLRSDGTYLLRAGPGTGIDTKFGKDQRLYVPKQLAEDLLLWSASPAAKKRRSIFLTGISDHENGQSYSEQDCYLFLSDQGNCYYMAEDDPRYSSVKSRPIGQVTETIRKKLMRTVDKNFPISFTYHWLRATFAFQLYQQLVPLLQAGNLQYGEEISIIQHRLHHADRETTENYLKLFMMYSEKLVAQERYEDWLIGFGGYSDLKLDDLNA
ncbi:site-specific integrase [uncultured Pseudomonas sp.]|uniref:site-specific integrase n=1 Tax=uncultured Pseudomonas sp. TaxID=114707 RepID=UPI0030DC41ED